MKISQFFAELREAITIPTKGSLVKAILLLVAILLCAIGLSLVLLHFLPDEEQIKEQFSRYGYIGIFLVTLFSSFTVIFPAPGTIVWLSLVIALDLNLAWAAVVASIGGTLGEITAYYVGYAGRAVIAPEHTQRYQTAERWMKRHGGFAIFLFALVPMLIFDFVGIAAGVLKYPVRKFLAYCWLGRLPRSFIECYVYYYTGKTLLNFILPFLSQ